MRMTINFLMKKARQKTNGEIPVYVRFTLKSKRVELSTGIYCHPDNWDEVGQQIKGRNETAKILNNRLSNIQNEIQDYYNQLKSNNEEFDVISIKNKLLNIDESKGIVNIFDYYLNSILEKLNKGYSMETYKHYKSSRKRLAAFIKYHYSKKDYPVESIDYKFLDAFDVYLKKRFKVHQNTAWNYHKHLRRVLNLAISMDHINKNPYNKYKVKLKETHREFLTTEELSKLEEKEIQIERLAVVRDIFVFACYTGLSFSDISKLSIMHLQKGIDEKMWIIIDRSKTGNRCRIPLLPKAKEILHQYSNYPKNQSKGLLLPVLTNQKMNSYLKELGDICGIKKEVTMHVARHTFATSVTLEHGVPIETVSKMLGHTSLKTTQIYARIVDKKISEDMELLQTKLCEKKKVRI
ncbi:site-specific integrase [Maribellus sp. CM-23]|uniref:site-specific integrase n=1 Tax=Maribellus sp. CM-23 TaxID=2781026 RepID=UPI001F196EDE|nr:site-specific integrase [Maribellus sp. CM-23]MCE4564655.1 site-specific integrase [Maribellus sp. CM-23]